MVEPIVSLAFSIHHNPQVYALLLGSGISRSAKILTGWEIVIDLINKLAYLEKVKNLPDPIEWYKNKFKEEPNYSKILEKLNYTKTEISQLLKGYFEPNDNERSEGIKTLTIAHKSIAKLVKYGKIKVIITTNFDRLLEIALEEEGIVPDIVSTEDQQIGAIPYIHSKCFIVKVNGDYKDTRLKNTVEELSTYSTGFKKLLMDIFENHGLIICGWSGEWDNALRNALFRNKTRRFTTYWCSKGKLTDVAKSIIQHSRASIIKIENADYFFSSLEDKIDSLAEYDLNEPLSVKLTIDTTKKFLSDNKYDIKLNDLITTEVKSVHQFLINMDTKGDVGENDFRKSLVLIENKTENILQITSAISYYGHKNEKEFLKIILEGIILTELRGGNGILIDLLTYPALLTFYSSGIIDIFRKKFDLLAQLMLKCTTKDYNVKINIIKILNPHTTFTYPSRDGYKHYFPQEGAEREFTPAHNYIYNVLHNFLNEYFVNINNFEESFDIFEYFLGLVYTDLITIPKLLSWAPIGRFHWKYNYSYETSPLNDFIEETKNKKNNILELGFFNNSVEQFEEALKKYQSFLSNNRWF